MNGITSTLKRSKSELKQLTKEPLVIIAIVVSFLLFFIFIIYPIGSAVIYSLKAMGENGIQEENFSLKVYEFIFTHKRFFNAISNSLVLGIIVASTCTVMGFIFAFAMARIKLPLQGVFKNIALLPIISPPFMFAISVILLFGRSGLITFRLLGIDRFEIYGLPGLIIVQTISMFPIAFMTLMGVLQAIDPDLETCAMNLGARRFKSFRSVTLPLALPGIFAAWLLTFVASITDFGNPIIIGGDFNVLSVLAYLEFTGMGNLPRGCALAIVLLVPTVCVFFLQKYIMRKNTYATITGKSTRRATLKAKPYIKVVLFIFCSLLILIILMFYGTIIFTSFVNLWGIDWTPTLKWFEYAYTVGMETFQDTVFLASIATPITAIFGMIVAFLVVRKVFPGRHFLELLTMMSYAIPGTAIGIGYILAFNKPPLLLTGTAVILIACYIFRNIPIGVEAGVAALKQISAEIEESSANLGANTAHTFRKITLPLITPAFFAGATFSFVRCMTAISAIIFLVSGSWRHLTILTLGQTEDMRLGAAGALSTILILVIIIALFLIKKITGLGQEKIFGEIGH